MVKPPFSIRTDSERLKGFFVLREGVPDGLMPSLLDWAGQRYWDDLWGVYEHRLRRLERRLGMSLSANTSSLSKIFHDYPELLLDAIDVVLTSDSGPQEAAALSEILAEARSVYTVGVDENGDYELQFRQPPELTETVRAATHGSSSAQHHLRQAWSSAFGREPEPTAACDEAVRAIEAAAKPVVTPNDSLATLGKMITALRDAPHKWTTDSNASDDLDAVVAMLELVWKGYRRHGDPSQAADASVDTAQMLVQTAALLVHWFQSGHIRQVA